MGHRQFLLHGIQPDEPIRLDGLEREIASEWEDYQRSRYSWLTRRLPLLITDAMTASQQYGVDTDDGLHAHRLLASVYQLATGFLTKIGEADLASLSATKGLSAAHASGSELMIGSLYRSVAHALLSIGEYEQAVALTRAVSDRLQSDLGAATPEYLSMHGTLQLVGALPAARHDNRTDATTFLVEAEQSARRFGQDANYLWTAFGPIISAQTLNPSGTTMTCTTTYTPAMSASGWEAMTLASRSTSPSCSIAQCSHSSYLPARMHQRRSTDFPAAKPSTTGTTRSNVLDGGCGTGRVAIELARRGLGVVGADLDPDMIGLARAKAPELTWVQADLSELNLAIRFDAVVLAGNVIPFAASDRRAAVVIAWARRLAPGGRLIAGFQLREGWPTVADYDTWCATVGLTVRARRACATESLRCHALRSTASISASWTSRSTTSGCPPSGAATTSAPAEVSLR